ncbi:DivIVA domain-containing protein [Micromonospora sp. Llam0]|uniref:DivIVA domain-containing protein n=1 Tax=Micromonospora sp. Llam0 TaxID=2485143 RepID=UPI000FB188CA|nr:DivIVA domain-containing protein [Micromonospora sp. Llam0]
MRRLLNLVLFPRRTRRQSRLLASLANQTRPATRPPAAAAGGGSRPPARHGGNAATHLYYGASVVRPSINPGLVRDRRFPVRTRRGFDPTEVRAFLHLVADELTAVRAELAVTRDENVRIKQALRDWQSRQFQAGMPA